MPGDDKGLSLHLQRTSSPYALGPFSASGV